MAENGDSIQNLPPHLLYKVLTTGSLSAEDLARIESTCYAFKASYEMLPRRFSSIVEIAALELCNEHHIFSGMPQRYRSQLFFRCNCSWKLVLRFLHAIDQAHGSSTVFHRQIQVAAGKYHTLLVHRSKGVSACGWGLPCTESYEDSCNETLPSSLTKKMACVFFLPVERPQGVSIAYVSSSYQHAAFITNIGELYTYGENISGCLGIGGSNQKVSSLTLVETMKGIPCSQVSTGLNFTMVLTMDGSLYTFGTNSHGQLGQGDTQERLLPTKVEEAMPHGSITQVCAGAAHAFAVTQDGYLFSWGSGGNLCLGHGDTTNQYRPRLVESFKSENLFILRVSGGDEHSVAMDSNGKVYTWGKGYCGALGQGDETDQSIPTPVRYLHAVRAVQVCAKKRKTFVLSDDGRLFAFGWMGFGSLGMSNLGVSQKVLNPSLLTSLDGHHITHVSAGLYHTIVLTDKDAILGFGDNDRGQLGQGGALKQEITEVLLPQGAIKGAVTVVPPWID